MMYNSKICGVTLHKIAMKTTKVNSSLKTHLFFTIIRDINFRCDQTPFKDLINDINYINYQILFHES